MKTANEIQNALDSIRYYSGRIKELARQQLELDTLQDKVDPDLAEVRFNALGALHSGCSWLEIYCDQIGANLKHAVEQDNKFIVAGEENG